MMPDFGFEGRGCVLSASGQFVKFSSCLFKNDMVYFVKRLPFYSGKYHIHNMHAIFFVRLNSVTNMQIYLTIFTVSDSHLYLINI